MTKLDKNRIREELEKIKTLSKMYDEIGNTHLQDQEALETAIIRMKVAKEQILRSTKEISENLQRAEK